MGFVCLVQFLVLLLKLCTVYETLFPRISKDIQSYITEGGLALQSGIWEGKQTLNMQRLLPRQGSRGFPKALIYSVLLSTTACKAGHFSTLKK